MELANKYKTALGRNGINTNLRLAHFFAQLDHESGLKPISENLNYSSDGLMKVFGKYFLDKKTADKSNSYCKQSVCQ
jgi:putative chitinase